MSHILSRKTILTIRNLSWPKSKEKILTSLLTATTMKMNSKYSKPWPKVKGRWKERNLVVSFFLSVKNVWAGSKIGLKILEIKSAEINAAFD